MDSSKPSVTDLANMRFPVRFACEGLGEVVLEPWSADFGDWARRALSKDLDVDATALTRDMLASLATTAGTETPVAPADVLSLSPTALDAAANRFIDESGTKFLLTYIGEGSGADRRVRLRDGSQLYLLHAQLGETGSVRLRRVLVDWLQDQRDATTHLIQDMMPSSPVLEAEIAKQTALSTLMPYKSPLADLGLEGLKSAGALDVLGPLGSAGSLSSVLALQSTLPDWKSIAGLSHMTESLRLASLLRLPVPLANLGALAGAGLPSWITTATDLGLHTSIMNTMPMLAMAQQIPTLDPFASSVLAVSKAYEDQFGFLKAANRSFNLGLAATTIAALTTVQMPDFGLVGRAMSDAMAMPPGFQLAASLGLSGAAAQGVTADVLRFYDETLSPEVEPTAFSALQDGARHVDDGTLDAERVDALLAQVAEALSGKILSGGDPIARVGRFEIFNALIAFIGAAAGIFGAYVAVESLEVSKTGLAHAQAESHAPADPAGLAPRLDQLHHDLTAARSDALSADRTFRFVHKAAPLRLEPDGSGQLLRVVYPDQSLKVLDERGAWLKVEVFDYHAGATVTGWLNRRHVRSAPYQP